jgi:hypothetical protein
VNRVGQNQSYFKLIFNCEPGNLFMATYSLISGMATYFWQLIMATYYLFKRGEGRVPERKSETGFGGKVL